MGRLGDDFRNRSDEQHKAALALFDAADFTTDPKSQVLFVVGKNAANTLQLLGEVVDYLEAMQSITNSDEKLQKLHEANDAIRRSAALGFATGNWGEFDRLIGGSDGGSGESTSGA